MLKDYLLIGAYLDQDPPQRFADSQQAESPEQAEAQTLEAYDPQGDFELAIVGVVELVDGKMIVVA